jgi:hypothetical protein
MLKWLRQFICNHRYTPWSDTGKKVGSFYEEFRVCNICGKKQFRWR